VNELKGFIDMHIHTAPDIRPRKMNDVEVARAAAAVGMVAIGLKSHNTLTADRAAIAQTLVPQIHIFGGLVLNEAVGGLNPAAVEFALGLDAKVIWLPTISARNHRAYHGESGGISIFTPDGSLQTGMLQILECMKDSQAILATGHISADEIQSLVPVACEAGVEKIVITHPEVPWINLSIEQQISLKKYGVYFERCYVSIMEIGGSVPFDRITQPMREVGVDSTILSTDYGAASLPDFTEGYRQFVHALKAAGFTADEIFTMGAINPSNVLGIQWERH